MSPEEVHVNEGGTAEVQEHEGHGEPMEGIEAPADGTMVELVSGEAAVEPVGSGGRVLVWECSLGDFTSHVEQEVVDHVGRHAKPKAAPKAPKPATRGSAAKKG
jgi:hypothetical protein